MNDLSLDYINTKSPYLVKRADDGDYVFKNTTLIIVDAFFRENLDGLLYMCDTSDSREAARNRLFLRWFEESAEPDRFTIKTASAVIEGQGIYAAIIVENRNPLAKAIVDDFELTAQMLTEDK